MPTTVVLLIVLHLLSVAAAQRQPSMALRECRETCGNVTVPYPFGIGAGCYRDDGVSGFQLDCDDSGPSPPRLTIVSRGYRLADISLAAGEATTFLNATRSCYNSSGGFIDGKTDTYMGINHSPYLFSSNKTQLVAIGCPTLGFFVDGPGQYVSGCMSVCRPAQYDLPGPCTGVGCCRSAIPKGVDFFEPAQNNFPPGQSGYETIAAQATPCHYVFLVQTDWFDSERIILNRTDDFEVPVVLDWAIRNVGKCSAAEGNATADFACRSAHSKCFDVDNGDGYRCNCSKGYGGNPYIDGVGGCIDIDECQHKENYGCHAVCVNTEGNFTCKCPPEETGDPNVKNGCRPKDKFTVALKAVTGVGVGVILLGSIFCGTCLALQKSNLMRTKKKFFEHNGGVILQQQMRSYNGTAGGSTGGFKIFSSEELKKATNNFATDQILGRGGHGIVYRGVLADNSVVAIKKSKMMEEAETKEFTREMLILSQINHRNVVKLLGCCLEVEVPMLVYEYVSNGTLYQYIHGGKGLNADTALDTRLRIGAESAEALAYMHSSASPPILHGDVKTANILLDGSLTAKVTDFGASKLAPSDEAEVIATLVQGTCGYLDPEYLMTCQLTDKSDVYSFGVVMLELLTRKKVLCFDGPEENRSLVSCFVAAVKAGRHDELMDGNVRKEMGPEALEEVTHLLMRCVSMSGDERPGMKEVAERLEALRRYQRHPWGHAGGGDLEEGEDEKSLLGRKQQCDVDYKFRPHDVLDLEGDSTYIYL
ncbi:wall-associated receptor kinase 1-like [Lolium rigidum]|uniref:wall-associated receptor kinase 1-like n=1 Tax=Lolium rigidum TaxID=89674 RepID=UPI001F5D808C|nr:wall-associated receptor kinase 1-like [Lolium rigidum]